MIKKIFSLVLFLCVSVAFGQIGTEAPWMENLNSDTERVTPVTFDEIVNAFETYWADKDHTVKGSGYKPFKRWESLYKNYVNPDGTLMTSAQVMETWQQKNAMKSRRSADLSNWESVGPLDHINSGSWSSGQGRVNAMAVDPSNTSTYYVGAPAGGIWKSTDSGTTWEPLIDQFPQIGVSAIAVHPTNSDIIYIGTGDDDAGDASGIGILKTEDGGTTWNYTGLNENNSPQAFSEIFFHPTNTDILWASSSSGLFKTTDGGATWSNKRGGNIRDLRLKPGDPNTLYCASSTTFFKSTDGGETWSPRTNGTPTGSSRIAMDVTPANPEVVYLLAAASGSSYDGIYKSTDSGETFTKTSSPSPDVFESSQAWYDMAFAVSDVNENEIYTGVLNVWKSSNSGANFIKINNWSSPTQPSYTHADIHNLRFIEGRLFCGSDGGIYVSDNGGAVFTSLTKGLAIGQFYRIGVSTQSSELIAGGLQDNGGYARNNDTWYNYYGADGMENVIDPNNPNKVYGLIQNGGGPYVSNDGGSTLATSGFPSGPESGNWITPLAFSADGRLFAGYTRVYEFDTCALTWSPVSQSLGGRIDLLVTDPNDANIMYAATDGVLRKSEDAGVSFAIMNNFGNDITWVDVKQGDSSVIYVTTQGTGGRVFKGDVAGPTVTLTDITGSLPNIPKLVIKHQGRHADNPLFLGTSVGVWRYDDITSDWEPFENNLPNVAVRDLEINLNDGVLVAGTYGRGVWRTDIPQDVPPTDVAITNLSTGDSQFACGDVTPVVTVKNNGQSSITTLDFTYTIDGATDDFQWTGTLASLEEIDIALPVLSLTPAAYTLEVSVALTDDAYAENNSATSSFNANGAGTFNELNSFETANDELIITNDAGASDDCGGSGGSNSVWERGVPSGTLLSSAASGSNAYGTVLSGNHPDAVKEYLVTECYDFTQWVNPVIKFEMAFDLEIDFDIVYVEYSKDGGSVWEVLGTANDPNWYNSDTVPGSNCQKLSRSSVDRYRRSF